MRGTSELESFLESRLPGAIVEVRDLTGTEDHFGVLVASDAFAGKGLLEQHRVVMALLKDHLDRAEVHAVKLKTMTLAAYQQRGGGEVRT